MVSPMSYKSYGNLVETYTKKGDSQKTIKALDRSLSIYPLSKTHMLIEETLFIIQVTSERLLPIIKKLLILILSLHRHIIISATPINVVVI